mmetsp:Transcript_37930/g.27917  ORF Transcript_37930/g.27917 Transcript_37930/m.27917 type:complete len:95 (+) Transcript_37930:49-333(+)
MSTKIQNPEFKQNLKNFYGLPPSAQKLKPTNTVDMSKDIKAFFGVEDSHSISQSRVQSTISYPRTGFGSYDSPIKSYSTTMTRKGYQGQLILPN